MFIEEFDHLYAVRNCSAFPFQNPMNPDPQMPANFGLNGTVLFPTRYKFEQDVYGVATRAFPDLSSISTIRDIRSASTPNVCLACTSTGCVMGSCDESNQQFSYDTETYQIKLGTTCMDYTHLTLAWYA